jgi:hypothetical protein
MKTRIALLLALAGLLAALPTAAFGGAAHRFANSQTFPDSTGEDAAAPDITSVQVSNDNAGLITFKINLSNRPTFTQDMFFLIFMNTDGNTSTGDPNSLGADYVIELDPGQVSMGQWNGSGYVNAPSQTSLIFGYDSTGATIKVSASEIGHPKTLQFAVIAASGFALDASGNADFTNVHTDNAPDPGHGFFSYQVLTQLALTPTAFTVAPKPAHAGRPVSVALAVNENDTNGPVTKGVVTCTAVIGTTRVVAYVHALTNGIATCTWRTPKTAKGKTIHGTIKVTVQGVSISRPFSARLF